MGDATAATGPAPDHGTDPANDVVERVIGPADDARSRATREVMRSGRESSRSSVLFRAALADKLGLTVSDMECIDFLMEAGAVTAGQLAERTRLTTGAITGMLKRLAAAGLITTDRDESDRRKVIVSLAKDQLSEAEHLYETYLREATRVLDGYSRTELEFLARHNDAMTSLYNAQLAELNS